ncbi:MAG TPA: hypothetical protein VLM38_24415 [Blastocatellia bacterium]|nr:hypothetical protein [Blastocatellia bacterium]
MDRSLRKVKIGVMGSSGTGISQTEEVGLIRLADELGQVIAESGSVLVTGATTGIPEIVSRSVQRHGGLSVGISPAMSREEHVSKYRLPDDGADIIIYTGFGLKGRNVINVRACDIVIIFGGGVGTLNEFTIAYDEGKVIGVLEGTGGTADMVRQVGSLSTKPTRSKLLFDSSPVSLVRACLSALGEFD